MMGGFAGGDEAGFWDDETLFKVTDKNEANLSNHADKIQSSVTIKDAVYSLNAHAAITPFIKFTGEKDGKPTFISRVVYLADLHDTIRFEPCKCDHFTIEGCDEIEPQSNTIFKAYQALLDYTNDPDVEEFFHEHKVHVTKRIPSSAGLSAAASDAAAFLRLAKEACNLVLSFDELVSLGTGIDPAAAFFIHNTPSANISGFGETVDPFTEETLQTELVTVDRKFDLQHVFNRLNEHLVQESDLLLENWEKRDTRSLLKEILDPVMLNDLYAASLLCYPDIKEKHHKGWYASSYGRTMFKVKG